jgi:ribonuclease P protein component
LKKTHSNKLRRYGKIKKAGDVYLLLKNGSKWECPAMRVCYLPNRMKRSRIGIIISKEMGIAVIRNKIKRTARELFRKKIAHLEPHLDVLIKLKSKNAPLVKKQFEETIEKWIEIIKR